MELLELIELSNTEKKRLDQEATDLSDHVKDIKKKIIKDLQKSCRENVSGSSSETTRKRVKF